MEAVNKINEDKDNKNSILRKIVLARMSGKMTPHLERVYKTFLMSLNGRLVLGNHYLPHLALPCTILFDFMDNLLYQIPFLGQELDLRLLA